MATTKSEPQTVAAATTALEEAQRNRAQAAADALTLNNRVGELEQQLRGGDLSIKPKTLTDARRDAEHARLLVESHDGIVHRAVKAHAQARLAAVGQVAQRVDADLCNAFDRITAPLVSQLADLLSALHKAHSHIGACHAGEGALSLVEQDLTTITPGVRFRGGSPSTPYELDIDLPTLEEFLGEVLVAASERAAVDRSAIMTIQGPMHSVHGVDVKRLMDRWYGPDGKIAPELAKHVTPARLADVGD